MKKLLLFAIVVCVLGAMGCSVHAVDARPADVVYDRPVSPGPDYIWFDGDWVWTGGAYHWHAGHWGRPREGRAWIGGNWEAAGHGWRWHRGHWR